MNASPPTVWIRSLLKGQSWDGGLPEMSAERCEVANVFPPSFPSRSAEPKAKVTFPPAMTILPMHALGQRRFARVGATHLH